MGFMKRWEAMQGSPVLRCLQILVVCTLYMIVGPSLILLNKYILKVSASEH